jgi:hypothetical protein
MADKMDTNFSTTAPCRIFSPQLLVAKAFKRNNKISGEPKFSALLAFKKDHPDVLPMKQMVAQLTRLTWPGRDFSELAFPFNDGDKRADKAKAEHERDAAAPLREHERGYFIVPARSKFRPILAATVNNALVEIDAEQPASDLIPIQAKFYYGAEAFVRIKFATHDEVGANKAGVNVYLNWVGATGKGERIKMANNNSAALRGYLGQMSSVDPTAGMADDTIPF